MIAHALAHVKNHDTLTMTSTATSERTMGRKGTVALSYDEDAHYLIIDPDATEQAKAAWGGKSLYR